MPARQRARAGARARLRATLALSQVLQDGLSRDAREFFLHTVTESDFAESLHEQALQGVGLAWLPRGLVGDDLRSGRLVAADPQALAVRFEIRLYRNRSPRNELVQKIWAAHDELERASHAPMRDAHAAPRRAS